LVVHTKDLITSVAKSLRNAEANAAGDSGN
jgi:hypothetical protein